MRTNSESPLLEIIIAMILLFLYIADGESCNRHSSEMSAWNSSKTTHIYTVNITYFVLKFCERFFKTRSIIHVTCTNIYIYIRTCVHDGMEMRHNLFVDLLTHKRNEFVSLRRRVLRDYANFTNFIFFWQNVTLMLYLIFIILLSYRTIHVFLV
jgi:hypothetical protein